MSVDPQRLDNLNDLLDKLFAARKVYRAACLAEVQARVEVDRAMAVFNEAVDRGRRGDLAPTKPILSPAVAARMLEVMANAETAYLGEALNAHKSEQASLRDARIQQIEEDSKQ